MKTVLCIDDYQPFLKLVGMIVETAGCSAILTTNPRHGVAIATSGGDIDLVISDLIMPQLSGLEVIQQIRRYRPAMPIVILSGVEQLPFYGMISFLRKSGDWQLQLLEQLAVLTKGEKLCHIKIETPKPAERQATRPSFA